MAKGNLVPCEPVTLILILFNASFFLFTYLLNDRVSRASYILALSQVGRYSTFPEGPTDPPLEWLPLDPPHVCALYMSTLGL